MRLKSRSMRVVSASECYRVQWYCLRNESHYITFNGAWRGYIVLRQECSFAISLYKTDDSGHHLLCIEQSFFDVGNELCKTVC